jgi:DeoR/GlpR family transcriptional regulator of sugar metabolism
VNTMKKNIRIEAIKTVLMQRGVCSINELFDEIEASQSTVRRDLTALEKQGFIERYHGSAVCTEYAILSHLKRMMINREEKEEIGRKAAALVKDRQTLVIGAGSTASILVNHLAGKSGLTIITPSISIARQLSSKNDFTVILTGGVLDLETHSLTGHLAELSMEQIHADIAFIGCDSISPSLNVMNVSFDIAALKKSILKASSEKILIADHTKFGKAHLASIGSISQFDKLVVDSKIPEDYLKRIRDLGVEVVI